MGIERRTIIKAAAVSAALGSIWPRVALAQTATYPARPIRLILPFPPGGSSDVVARLLAQKLTERLGQSVFVDNKPGANSVVGTEELLRAPADGYTMLLVGSTHSINPLVMSLPYNTQRDFAPVSPVYKVEFVLVVHPSVPANNLQEFVALARSKPDQLNFAAADNAGITHLSSEIFNSAANTRIPVVTYKGTGPALNDTLGGHAQVMLTPPTVAIQHLKTGKLKALAISGRNRSSAVPDVPTFAEAGLPGVETNAWGGILMRTGTPRPVVTRLAEEIAEVMNLADVKAQLTKDGLDRLTSTPDQFDALIRRDTARFDKIIKDRGIKMQR